MNIKRLYMCGEMPPAWPFLLKNGLFPLVIAITLD